MIAALTVIHNLGSEDILHRSKESIVHGNVKHCAFGNSAENFLPGAKGNGNAAVKAGHHINVGFGDFLIAVGKAEVDIGLLGKHKGTVNGGPGVLIVGKDANCISLSFGKNGSVGKELFSKLLHFQSNGLCGIIAAEKAELTLTSAPIIGGIGEVLLIGRAPPVEAVVAVGPKGMEESTNVLTCNVVAANHIRKGSNLFCYTGLAA